VTRRAVLLDAGGTIVLPARELVAEALARAGFEIDPADVPDAHYAAVGGLDADQVPGGQQPWAQALCAALGVSDQDAVRSLIEMADRRRSGRVLWSEPTPGAIETLGALRRAGIAVAIVTNSDGNAARNLRDAGFLAATGLDESDVIDSVVVGSSKPNPGIFEAALERVGVGPGEALHVGDMISTDVRGASAAGMTAIHFDPGRSCRDRDHRHVRSLGGIWTHLAG
jgi:HAD superfamily hydrolase (TIGR01509 family)